MKKYLLVLFGVAMLVLPSSTNLISKVHTSAHYENAIRQCFREERWEAGKYMIDEAEPYYGELSVFQELKGWWYYHVKDYDKSRYCLTKCLRDDPSNYNAREIMIKVEYETENYSSAICYINEQLELNPYDKGLWRKKIEINRLQGNDGEADNLLDRLYRIYPNDSTVRNDVKYRNETLYGDGKKKGDLDSQIKASQKIADVDPYDVDNYLHLTNLYLRMGKTDDALSICGRGVSITNSFVLIRKYTGILCDQGMHQAALAYLNGFKKTPQINSLIASVQQEQARYANANDPYTAYGKLYEKTKSNEAFTYLINTAISRGYWNDALYYIKDYLKNHKETENILYKEYTVYKALGNEPQATAALERLYEINPSDTDTKDELCSIYYKQGVSYMADEDYRMAIKPLIFVSDASSDHELIRSAKKRLSVCYAALNAFDEAIDNLDETDSLYRQKKADLLAQKGDYDSALVILKETEDSVAYGETAVPYCKKLMEEKQYEKALATIDTALNYCSNKELYQYAISASSLLKKDSSSYIEKGYERYPMDDYFIEQYAGLKNSNALMAKGDKDYDKAMEEVDLGLEAKPSDSDLLYTKGLIYESKHQYDSAYVYQKSHKPDDSEKFAFRKKMQGLASKSLKNEIGLYYQRARLGSEDVITANAGVYYNRKLNSKNTIGGFFNYAGRDDATTEENLKTQQTPGGIGIQAGLQYSHYFNKGWSIDANGAYGTKYFPKWSARLDVSKELPKDWLLNVHGQYRKVDSYEKVGTTAAKFDHWKHSYPDMWSVGASATKTIGKFGINFGADGFLIKDATFFSGNVKVQYSPFDYNRTKLYATGGIGTAPEITLIDSSLPSSFEKINTHVGMGGVYSLTQNVDIGIEGNWHTMYKQNQNLVTNSETTSYVNLFYAQIQLVIRF